MYRIKDSGRNGLHIFKEGILEEDGDLLAPKDDPHR
jgi:hypothetical protein